ncbi:hypothetical protein AB0H83_42490 [Dactylosporangium sp. NPDC050688]|uniref:hypothetical protein n=1 Tax=Dactylosporangium sp. NPDC050688 TaxID=3157217 RepID=UPI0033D912D0
MPDLLDDVTAAAGLTVFGAAAVAGGIDTRTPLPDRLPDWSPDYDVVPRVTALRAELRAVGLDRIVLAGGGAPARAAEAITRTLGVPLTVLSGTDPHGAAAAVADRLQRTVVVLTSASATSTALATDSHRRAYLQAFEEHNIHDPGRRFVFVTVPGSPLATTALEMGAQLFLAQPGALSAFSLVPAGLAGADIGDLVEQAFALAEPPRRRSAPAGFALPTAGFTPALPTPRTGDAGPATPGGFGTGVPAAGVFAATGASAAAGPPAAAGASTDFGSSSASGNRAESDAVRFGHPAVALGAALAAAVAGGRDKLALASDGSGIVGLGEWVAELLTAAGSRAVPVVLETPGSWGHEGPDVLSVTTGGALVPGVMPGGGIAPDLAVNGPLGAQLLAWEQALTVAGLVEPATPAASAIPAGSAGPVGSAGPAGFSAAGSAGSARAVTGAGGPAGPGSQEGVLRVLDLGLPPEAPAFVDGAVEVHCSAEFRSAVGATTLIGALDEFARTVPPGGILAVHAHLDPTADAAALALRTGLAGRVVRAVTFAWGGTQVQPGAGVGGGAGTPAASIIQITGAVSADLRVPGRPYTFGDLQAAEAADDRQVLLDRGLPLLRLHLTDRKSGIDQLLAALGG